ncbi:hypothetical protein TNCV_5059761 [Trichonephila clavipes]|nr:hypothetical protein TNCV_5059761 [Trichonephila clavipes]
MEVAVFLVWGGIMLGRSVQTFHIFDAGSVQRTHYCNEILLPYVYVHLLERYGSAFPFHGRQCTMPSHSSCRQLLESRRLAARTLPPVTIRELRLALQDEWVAMPQQLVTPSFSAWADAVKPA